MQFRYDDVIGKTVYDLPPGPLDNSRLEKRVRDGLKLRNKIDYESVTDEVWTVLKNWYGEASNAEVAPRASIPDEGDRIGGGGSGGGGGGGNEQQLRVRSEPGAQGGRRRSPRQAAAASRKAAVHAAGLPEKTRSAETDV